MKASLVPTSLGAFGALLEVQQPWAPSLGTGPVCQLLFYMLWRVRLSGAPPAQTGAPAGQAWAGHITGVRLVWGGVNRMCVTTVQRAALG